MQEAQKDRQEQGTVVRGRGRRYKMGMKGIRGLETRWGGSSTLAEGRPDCTVEVYRLKESEKEVTVLWQGAAPRVRAAKSSEFGEGKL